MHKTGSHGSKTVIQMNPHNEEGVHLDILTHNTHSEDKLLDVLLFFKQKSALEYSMFFFTEA